MSVHDLDDELSAKLLLGRLPVGVFVIDAVATVRFANERALQIVGFSSSANVVGRSVTEFVAEEDLAFLIEGIARGDDFPDTVLGPFRLRFIDRSGVAHWSESWAYSTPPDLGVAGYVVTLTPESVGDRLAMAAAEIAANSDVNDTLSTISDAMAAYPLEATTAVLTVTNGAIREAVGSWPSCLDAHLFDSDAPWASVAAGGRDLAVVIDDLPHTIRTSVSGADLAAVWLHGVDVAGCRRAVIAAWRPTATAATPNQIRHLDQAAAMTALALSRNDHDNQLVYAAHHDALTGVGNRARLDHRLINAPLPGGLLYIDLDNFKRVNDEDGHTTGDAVLQEVASRLVVIAGRHGEVFRVGGDEFVVVFDASSGTQRLTNRMEVAATAALQCLNDAIRIDGVPTDITASVGLAVRRDHDTWLDMFERADAALLDAKRSGKQRWSRLHAPPLDIGLLPASYSDTRVRGL